MVFILFASGAFRNAYEARALSGLEGRFVLKRYIPEQVTDIESLFGSLEAHTRKNVQMNSLARYLAKCLTKECPSDYGETFEYTKVYFGKYNGECITVEVFIEGEFVKHINNTGHIVETNGSEVAAKAESFSHFTYVKSGKCLMVLDLQGTGYSLYDPEIASVELMDDKDDSIVFCSGNLSSAAIDVFFKEHKCSTFCTMLGLTHKDPDSLESGKSDIEK